MNEQDEREACDRYQVLNEAGEALLAANHGEAYEVIYRMMKAARAASNSANVAQDELQVRGRMRLKVEKLAGSLTKAEETKNDIIGDDGEQVTGVRIGWGAWALLRASIIDLIEYKCDSDSALAAAYSANVAQGAEAVCEHELAPMAKPHKECVKCGDVRLDTTPLSQTALTDAARDAIRYRWMRDFNVRCKDGVNVAPPCEHVFASLYSHAVGTIPATRLIVGEELDRTIDAALTDAQSASGDTE